MKDHGGPTLEAERAAFERQMTDAWPDVTRLVERLLAWPGKAADVEDVVQEVFLRAWHKRSQFKGDAEWTTWLHQIAVRRSRSAGRARSRRVRWLGMPTGDRDSASPTAEASAPIPPEDPRPQALRHGLARLGHADREVLVLRYLEGLDGNEVALQLGLKRSAVDARLSRARKRLRALVGQAEESP